MKVWAEILPVSDSKQPKFGAVILSDAVKPFNIEAAKYDFDTRRQAIKWVNKNFYKTKLRLLAE